MNRADPASLQRFLQTVEELIDDGFLVAGEKVQDHLRDLLAGGGGLRRNGLDLIFLDMSKGSSLDSAKAEVDTAIAHFGNRKSDVICC